jgi:hypothetical protein
MTEFRKSTERFLVVAQAYVSFIDQVASGSAVSLRVLHRLLSQLQEAATNLPIIGYDLDDAACEVQTQSFE